MTPTSRALLRDLAIATSAIAVGVLWYVARPLQPPTTLSPNTSVVEAPSKPTQPTRPPLFIRTGADRDFDALTLRDLPSAAGIRNVARHQNDVFLLSHQDLLRYRISDGVLLAQLNRRAGTCDHPTDLAMIHDILYVACGTQGVLAIDPQTERMVRMYGTREGFDGSSIYNLGVTDETLWAGTSAGVARIDTDSGSVTWYRGELGISDSGGEVSTSVSVDHTGVRAMVRSNYITYLARFDGQRWSLCPEYPFGPDPSQPCELPYATPKPFSETGRDALIIYTDDFGAWSEMPLKRRKYVAMIEQSEDRYVLLSTAGWETLERGQAFPVLVAPSTMGSGLVAPERKTVLKLITPKGNDRYAVALSATFEDEFLTELQRYTINVYDHATRRSIEGSLDARAIPASSPVRIVGTNTQASLFVNAAIANVRSDAVSITNPSIPGTGLQFDLKSGRIAAFTP